MSANRRSAQRRDVRGFSRGKIEAPTGTVIRSRTSVLKISQISVRLSQYIRTEDAPVPGIQYIIRLSRNTSREMTL